MRTDIDNERRDDSAAGAFACPVCGGVASLRLLSSSADIKAYGCDQRWPWVAICDRCAVMYTRDEWWVAKGLVSVEY